MVRDPLSENHATPGWPVTGGDAILLARGVPIADVALMEDIDTVFIVVRIDDPARPLRVRSWPRSTAPSLDALADAAVALYRATQEARG
jgi:hypothetical protein